MPLKDDEDNGLTVSKSDYEAKGDIPEGGTPEDGMPKLGDDEGEED